MKYYLIAGESSGDLYGGRLMSELKRLDPQAEFQFWGGPEMQKESSGQLKSIEETSFMGFWEVAKNALTIKKFFDFAKYSIDRFSPDIILFIDYPGFNLRMATWAKNKGYKTAYYISPQLWAWKEGRHRILRDKLDLFFIILPFEREFYGNLDTPCSYVGHPLIELISDPELSPVPDDIKNIGLFPGSRKQEIKNHLPAMMEFVEKKKDYTFTIAGVSHVGERFYEHLIGHGISNVKLKYDTAHKVMSEIDFAIASSGTATLELALHQVPQIVIYKTSHLSFLIGKQLVRTDYISLVNLIAEKEVVPELLQSGYNVLALNEYFSRYGSLDNRVRMKDNYQHIRKLLGDGTTSNKVAEQIVSFLSNQ